MSDAIANPVYDLERCRRERRTFRFWTPDGAEIRYAIRIDVSTGEVERYVADASGRKIERGGALLREKVTLPLPIEVETIERVYRRETRG